MPLPPKPKGDWLRKGTTVKTVAVINAPVALPVGTKGVVQRRNWYPHRNGDTLEFLNWEIQYLVCFKLPGWVGYSYWCCHDELERYTPRSSLFTKRLV